MQVLIVEDERESREGLANFITKTHADITIAALCETGTEGLDAIKTLDPDLVITDIRMPDIDGLMMIKTCKDLSLKTEFIILSGYPDFSYAQRAINLGVAEYVLKPASPSRITEAITRIRKKLQPQIQNILLSPETYTTAQLCSLIPKADEHDQHYLIVITALVQPEQAVHTAKSTIAAYVSRNAICSLIENELYILTPIPEQDICSITHELIRSLRKHTDSIQAVYNPITPSISSDSSVLLMQEITQLLEHAILFPEGAIIDRKAVETAIRDLRPTPYPLSIEHELMNCLKEHKDAPSTSRVITRFSTYLQEQHTSPEQMHCYYYRLMISLLYKAKDIQQLEISDLSKQGCIQKIKQIRSYRAAEKILSDLLLICTEATTREVPYSTAVRAMLQVIHNHYASQFGLEDLSCTLKVSADHLSELFSKEIGTPFIKYLTRYRMNKACELLSMTEDRVRDIGIQVGYTDPSYFCRMFKKVIGISPKEYRKMH
jgi:two-component system, response regulator YesN